MYVGAWWSWGRQQGALCQGFGAQGSLSGHTVGLLGVKGKVTFHPQCSPFPSFILFVELDAGQGRRFGLSLP